MSRLRVALLATTVHFGGIERVLLTLLTAMESDVELVPVLFTRTDAREHAFFERLHALDIPHTTMLLNTSRAKYFNPVRNIRETLTFFKTQRFDLIHSHGYRADLIGLVAARRYGLPVVSTCHGFIGTDRHLTFYNRLNLLLLRRFTRVIAVSARMKEDLVSGGVRPSRIDVVTNAVAPATESNGTFRQAARADLGFDSGDIVFGYVGRLSEEKGLEYLLEATRLVASAHPRVRIVIVGEGSQRAALERQVREASLEARVRFVGFQSDPTGWYSVMDAFVLPSLTEGTPMALLEAMANQLPSIATAVGGVPAVIADGTNGLLVPAADAASFARAMTAIADDGALRDRLGREAMRSVQQSYDVRSWIRHVRAVYLSALEEGRSLS